MGDKERAQAAASCGFNWWIMLNISRRFGTGKQKPRREGAWSRGAPLTPTVVLSSLVINVIGLGLPLSMYQIYNRILPNRSTDTLLLLVLGLLTAFVAEAILKTARARIVGWRELRRGYQREMHGLDRLLAAAPTKIAEQPPGVWLDRLEAGRELRTYYGGSSNIFVIDAPFLLLYIVVFALVGGTLVFIPIGALLFLSLYSAASGERLQKLLQDRNLQDGRRYDFVHEVLENVLSMKSLVVESQILRRFERLQKSSSLMSYRIIENSDQFSSAGTLLANLNIVAVVSVGASQVIGSNMTIGALACCILLAGRITQPIVRLPVVWNEKQNAAHASGRMAQLLDLETPTAASTSSSVQEGELRLGNVTVSFANKVCLKDVTISIGAGDFVGVTGENGSGRTTLCRVMCGELTPESGTVEIEGIIHGRGEDATRSVRYVSSDSGIVEGSILQNITMFRSGARISRARTAAQLIGLEDDVLRLAAGYNTILGSNTAASLPPGFLQLLALARAIADEPRVLVLDEANTNVDHRGDQRLLRALSALRGRMTIVVVSNRPILLKALDRVYELQGGILREISTRALLSRPHAETDDARRLA